MLKGAKESAVPESKELTIVNWSKGANYSQLEFGSWSLPESIDISLMLCSGQPYKVR